MTGIPRSQDTPAGEILLEPAIIQLGVSQVADRRDRIQYGWVMKSDGQILPGYVMPRDDILFNDTIWGDGTGPLDSEVIKTVEKAVALKRYERDQSWTATAELDALADESWFDLIDYEVDRGIVHEPAYSSGYKNEYLVIQRSDKADPYLISADTRRRVVQAALDTYDEASFTSLDSAIGCLVQSMGLVRYYLPPKGSLAGTRARRSLLGCIGKESTIRYTTIHGLIEDKPAEFRMCLLGQPHISA